VRQGEIIGRIDSPFYSPNNSLNLTGKYPIATLRDLSKRIIQPTEFIREYVEDSENAIPVLRAANVEDGYLNTTDVVFISKERLKSAKDSFIEAGDLLITRTGAKAGATCVVRPLDKQYVISSHSIRVIPNKEKVIPEYLELFLLSASGKSQVNRLLTGAAQKQLQLASIATVQIPLPPLDVQKSLVAEMESARATRQAKLAEADNLLKGIDEFVLKELDIKLPKEEKRNTFAVKLSKVKQGRQDVTYYKPYYERLVNTLNKSKFLKVSLEKISPDLVGGATPTRGDAELYAEDGIKFLRILNIGENEIVLEDLNYIKEAVHNGELKRSQLKENDVLMTITGRVGTSAVVSKDNLPANINQHIVRMRIIHQECLPEYLAIYLNSSIGKALSNRGVTGGTRIALDYEVIKKIQIPLPPKAIQEKIIKELYDLQSQARQLRQQAESQWQTAKEKFEKVLLG